MKFRIKGKRVPAISLSWKEGKYFDVWMIVHTLSGFCLGLALGLFDLVLFVATVIVLILLILWEVGEFIFKVREEASNRIVDVIVGMIGFFLAWKIFVENYQFSDLLSITIISVILLTTLNLLGWRAYKNRK